MKDLAKSPMTVAFQKLKRDPFSGFWTSWLIIWNQKISFEPATCLLNTLIMRTPCFRWTQKSNNWLSSWFSKGFSSSTAEIRTFKSLCCSHHFHLTTGIIEHIPDIKRHTPAQLSCLIDTTADLSNSFKIFTDAAVIIHFLPWLTGILFLDVTPLGLSNDRTEWTCNIIRDSEMRL